MLFAAIPSQSLKYWDDACPEYSNYFYSPANAGISSGIAPDFLTPTDCHWQEASNKAFIFTSVLYSPDQVDVAAVWRFCTQALVGSSGVLLVRFEYRAADDCYVRTRNHGRKRKRNERSEPDLNHGTAFFVDISMLM